MQFLKFETKIIRIAPTTPRYCGNEVFPARNKNTQNLESDREISLRTNSARKLANFLSLLQATLPAMTIVPLYFRNLQRDLSKALNFSEEKQSYRTVVALSTESRGELMRWKTMGKVF